MLDGISVSPALSTLHVAGLSAKPGETLVWERIVLGGDAVTVFTENGGNPLCMGDVVTGSKSSVLKPLKTDSLPEGPFVWMEVQGGGPIS